MKYFKIILLSIGVFLIISCENVNDQQITKTKLVQTPTYIDKEEFNKSIEKLLELNDVEHLEWLSNTDYISLQQLFNDIIKIYDSIQTRAEYLELRDQYSEYLWFNSDIENAMIRLPLRNEILASLIDINGNAYIGDSLYNFKGSYTSLKNKTSFCSSKDGKRWVDAWLSTDEGYPGMWSILYAKGYKKRLWKWRAYSTVFHVKNEGTVYMVDWDNEGNKIDHNINMVRSSSETKSIRWDYRTPLFTNGEQQQINWKVWTRGVSEDKACYVTGLGLPQNY